MHSKNIYTIGRDPSCQLLINNHFVSREHSTLHLDERDRVIISDLGSANGTAVGAPHAMISSCPLTPMDLVYFSEDSPVPGSILLKHFNAWRISAGRERHSITLGSVSRFSGGRVYIGSSPKSDFLLPILGVAPRHLLLEYHGQWRVTDLVGEALLNRKVFEKAAVLQVGDEISIGAESVCVTFDGSKLLLARNRSGFAMEARKVTYSVKDRSSGNRLDLLSGVSFSILPGELVALMGPSGSGKTTLLNVLAGINPISSGEILYDNKVIRAGDNALCSHIGYVPQDDLLYDQLTVEECLLHSTRYRVPNRVATAQIVQKITKVCDSLGLDAKIRSTIIGSPSNKTLSGGQRKRVNLAMELVTDPLILFLDEPTSGLSSRDTRIVVEALRKLATEMCVAVIVTIHQPAFSVYQLFDRVAFLRAGFLAYFGAASPGSIKYFSKLTSHPVESPDDIMEALEEIEPKLLSAEYDQSSECLTLVRGRSQLISDLNRTTDALPQGRNPSSWMSQAFQFSRRYATCRTRDWSGLLVQLLQGPLIGLLLGTVLSPASPNVGLFLLVFVSIWFGTNNTAREIVSERMLFKRERRSGARIPMMLLSKFIVNIMVTFFQVFSMAFIALQLLDQLHVGFPFAAGICWAGSVVGVALGLTISSVARSEVSAIVITPLVLIPFILLGGLLVPYDSSSGTVKFLMHLVPSRWTYEAVLHGEFLELEDSSYANDYENAMRRGEFKEAQEALTKIPENFQPDHVDFDDSDRRKRIAIALGALAVTSVAFLFGSYYWIRRTS